MEVRASPDTTARTSPGAVSASSDVPAIVAPPLSAGALPPVTTQLFASRLSISTPGEKPPLPNKDSSLPLDELGEWRKRFDGLYGRLEASLAQATTTQAQDEELLQYKLATQTRIDQLTLLRESLQADVSRLSSSEKALQQLVEQRNERIRDLEQENYALRVKAAQSASDAKQALTRTTNAELARRVSEVRQHELQVSSEYALAEVEKLRGRLLSADEATRDALTNQLTRFETLRQGVVDAFTQREIALVAQMNSTVTAVHSGLRQELSVYCDSLEKEQAKAAATLTEQFQTFCAQRDRQYGDQLAYYQRRCSELETERQQLKERCDADIRTHTEQCKRREDQLMRVIAEREQALLQREAKLRTEHEAQQREMAGKWTAKEADLTAKHEDILAAAGDEARKDLTLLQSSFLEQIQKLSDAHLATEQAWQERYRERERELVRSNRQAAAASTTALSDSSAFQPSESLTRSAQPSFLSKFDAIEARQRERAEQVRSTIVHRHTEKDAPRLNTPSPTATDRSSEL